MTLPKFSEVLALVGIKPKTLTDATAAIDTSKATLDSVAALFTAAGLPLETMLAAGPDSLKSHLASLGAKDSELAAALAKVTDLEASLTAKTGEFTAALAAKETAHATALAAKVTELTTATASLTNATGFLAEIGFKPEAKDKDGKALAPDAIKPLWKAHLAKATNIEMSRLGVPERYIPKAIVEETGAAKADADIAKEYNAMARGPERTAFYDKHEAAIWRAARATEA